jgi:hypothetical protein
MTARKAFEETWNVVAKLLSNKPYAPVPDNVWEKLVKSVQKIQTTLKPYYTEPKVPGSSDIKAVKNHGITAQIKAYINKDKERKTFFTLGYFSAKCAALPDRTVVQAVQKGTTRDAYLTAFLVYHYWKARPESESGLGLAAKEIETDYRNSPVVQRAEQARALYRQLLGESDLKRIVAVVQKELLDKEDVGAFAKIVGIRIPAGKKTIHERLAAKIMASGELVRAKF